MLTKTQIAAIIDGSVAKAIAHYSTATAAPVTTAQKAGPITFVPFMVRKAEPVKPTAPKYSPGVQQAASAMSMRSSTIEEIEAARIERTAHDPSSRNRPPTFEESVADTYAASRAKAARAAR